MLRFTSASTFSTTNLHGIAVHYFHLLLVFLKVRNFHSPLHPSYIPSPFQQSKPGWDDGDDGDAYRSTWGWDPLHLFHGNHQRRRQVWTAMHWRPAGEQWRLRRWAVKGDGIQGIAGRNETEINLHKVVAVFALFQFFLDGSLAVWWYHHRHYYNQLDLVIEVFYSNLNHSEAWMARCKTLNLQDVYSFQHNSIYIYFRTCVSTYIHLKVYERFMDFSTPLDQDLATKSLNTSQSHQCLRMFRWEISLAKLSSKAPWRGDFFSICTLAHVCCFLQKVDHHIATRWVDLLWSVAVDLHRWRRCQYLAPWYPAIQHVFFSKHSIRTLANHYLDKVYLIDLWRCMAMSCLQMLWFCNDSQDTQSRNSGFMRIEIISPVNSSRMDDILRIPGHLIKQIMFWDFIISF